MNEKFANYLYDEYLFRIGKEAPEGATLREKEALFVENAIKDVSFENAFGYITAFVDRMAENVNFGEDQIVTTAVALNVISFLNYSKSNRAGEQALTMEELETVLDRNFEMAKNDGKRSAQEIAKMYRRINHEDKSFKEMSKMVDDIMRMIFGDKNNNDEDSPER